MSLVPGAQGALPAEPSVYAGARVAYGTGELSESDVAPSPLQQFRLWYADAVGVGLTEPNAMVLATSGAGGGVSGPSARTVLLKGVDTRGFSFFTNHGSRKAREIGEQAGVALVFPWFPMHRQVTVTGTASRLSAEESGVYFASRPWASQVGAWASAQSQPLATRDELDRRWAGLASRWSEGSEVPMPEHWGGYVVMPTEVEFWQGRPSRLHDRLVFLRLRGGGMDEPSAWHVQRRQP